MTNRTGLFGHTDDEENSTATVGTREKFSERIRPYPGGALGPGVLDDKGTDATNWPSPSPELHPHECLQDTLVTLPSTVT